MDKKEVIKALQAICDGYVGMTADGYIIVANPDATEEAIALGGVDPNIVVDCQKLIHYLNNSIFCLAKLDKISIEEDEEGN